MKLLDRFHAMIAGEVEPPPVTRLVGFRMTEADEDADPSVARASSTLMRISATP